MEDVCLRHWLVLAAKFEGVFESEQPCCVQCDLIGQQMHTCSSILHTAATVFVFYFTSV